LLGGGAWRGFEDAVWTRKAGWDGRTGGRGEEDTVVGAGGGGLASGAETGHGGGEGAWPEKGTREETDDGWVFAEWWVSGGDDMV
jgi:hypothetical protein